MRTVEDTPLASSIPLESLREVLEAHPVQLAILFGSHARETTHARSDLDIAVHFGEDKPTDAAYNDVFFGLSAALSEALDTDNVDLVDLRRCSPKMARSIFEHGVLLAGDQDDVSTVRQRLTTDEPAEQSPRERLDSAIDKINAHFESTAVPATDRSRRDRRPKTHFLRIDSIEYWSQSRLSRRASRHLPENSALVAKRIEATQILATSSNGDSSR